MATLRIVGGSGRASKIRAGDLLGALTHETVGLLKADVGKITVADRATYVAVAREAAEVAKSQLRRVKGKPVRVVVL